MYQDFFVASSAVDIRMSDRDVKSLTGNTAVVTGHKLKTTLHQPPFSAKPRSSYILQSSLQTLSCFPPDVDGALELRTREARSIRGLPDDEEGVSYFCSIK